MALIPTEGILDRRHRESPLKVGYALGHNIGQAFRFHGFRFEILRRQRHQITQIRVTPPQESPPAAEGK